MLENLLCEPLCPLWLTGVLGDPLQILRAARSYFQHQALWKIIGMQLFHGIANSIKKFGLGFDQSTGGTMFTHAASRRSTSA